jgi:mitochondrial pyruvate carrier 2
MATGAIWTRWCFIIKPRNIALAAVNFFLFCVGGTQVTRIFIYQQSVKEPLKQETKSAEQLVTDPIGVVKSVAEAK